MYLDVPFYHYFIGREGQSVQTDVMIRRVNQLQLVNRCMLAATPERGTVPDGLYRYMITSCHRELGDQRVPHPFAQAGELQGQG